MAVVLLPGNTLVDRTGKLTLQHSQVEQAKALIEAGFAVREIRRLLVLSQAFQDGWFTKGDILAW